MALPSEADVTEGEVAVAALGSILAQLGGVPAGRNKKRKRVDAAGRERAEVLGEVPGVGGGQKQEATPPVVTFTAADLDRLFVKFPRPGLVPFGIDFSARLKDPHTPIRRVETAIKAHRARPTAAQPLCHLPVVVPAQLECAVAPTRPALAPQSTNLQPAFQEQPHGDKRKLRDNPTPHNRSEKSPRVPGSSAPGVSDWLISSIPPFTHIVFNSSSASPSPPCATGSLPPPLRQPTVPHSGRRARSRCTKILCNSINVLVTALPRRPFLRPCHHHYPQRARGLSRSVPEHACCDRQAPLTLRGRGRLAGPEKGLGRAGLPACWEFGRQGHPRRSP